VLEEGDDLRFAAEALREGGIVQELPREDLEGNVTVEAGLS
jgi:hypothetical protein